MPACFHFQLKRICSKDKLRSTHPEKPADGTERTGGANLTQGNLAKMKHFIPLIAVIKFMRPNRNP